MADIFDSEKRSRVMAAIKSCNTKPEMLVRRYLHSHGLRYGLHNRHLPGKPDIVLRRFKTVIFVHGCFWHGHEGCKYFRLPSTNTEFWSAKINANINRDFREIKELNSMGWKVLVVWECQLRNKALRESTLAELYRQIITPDESSYSIAAESLSEYESAKTTQSQN